MSFNRQARIEVEPTHLSYSLWWAVPVTYQALPRVAAAADVVWIVALSALSWLAYSAAVSGQTGDLIQFIGVGIAVAAMFSTAGHAKGIYQPSGLLPTRSLIGGAWTIWCSTFLCLAVVAFALRISHMFSRGAMLLFFCAGLAAIAGSRIAFSALARRVIATGLLSSRRVVLLADETFASWRAIVPPLERYGYALSRVFTISATEDVTAEDPEFAQKLGGVVRYIRQRCPDEVILAIGWHRSSLIRQIMLELRSVAVPVRLLTDPQIEWLLKRPLQHLGPAQAVELQGRPLSILQRATKRLLDVVLAGGGLLLLLPVFVAIALAIRIDSPGPILFRQGRVGFNGRAFRIYKFRSMTTLDDGLVVRQACRNDQRVTRVGRVLRRLSLDELPQLINVLKGEMSLVGPRPHALAHDDEYSRLIAEYAARQKMKPGITGWAQINGCRGETPHVEMMKRRVNYDLGYIESWSLWFDLRILVMTVIHVVKDRNVY